MQHLNSESSSEDTPLHYTAKIEAASKGPGGIGSYLAKQEFGSNEGQTQTSGNQDSGYVSHGSGGGYPKMQLPVGYYSQIRQIHRINSIRFYSKMPR